MIGHKRREPVLPLHQPNRIYALVVALADDGELEMVACNHATVENGEVVGMCEDCGTQIVQISTDWDCPVSRLNISPLLRLRPRRYKREVEVTRGMVANTILSVAMHHFTDLLEFGEGPYEQGTAVRPVSKLEDGEHQVFGRYTVRPSAQGIALLDQVEAEFGRIER